MSFADLQRKHASFIAGHAITETVEYRRGGGAVWEAFSAQVTRNVTDSIGQLLRNTVDVFVSRTDVSNATPLVDVIRLPADLPPEGGEIPQYRVEEVLGRSDGSYLLRCIR